MTHRHTHQGIEARFHRTLGQLLQADETTQAFQVAALAVGFFSPHAGHQLQQAGNLVGGAKLLGGLTLHFLQQNPDHEWVTGLFGHLQQHGINTDDLTKHLATFALKPEQIQSLQDALSQKAIAG